MVTRDTPYYGGFVFTSEQISNIAHFEKHDIVDDFAFWCGEETKYSKQVASSGEFVIVSGHWALATESAAERSEISSVILNELLENGFVGVETTVDFLAGRWAAIVSDGHQVRVYNDAVGCRSVYYAKDREVVCTHFNLLRGLIDASIDFDVIPNKMNWAVDFTKSRRIGQLIPNFYLDLKHRDIVRFFPREENPYVGVDLADILPEVERLWMNVTDQYMAQYENFAVSMTGGFDSRLSVSMLEPYWDRLDCFTYGIPGDDGENTWAKVMQGDFGIVRELLELMEPKSHRFINLSKFESLTPELRETVRKNTTGKHGYHLLPVYRELFPGDDWLHIRGNGPEIWRYEPHVDPSFARILKLMQDRWPEDLEGRARELGYDDGLYGYNRYTMIYWELRHGRWFSEILNETDVAFETHVTSGTRRIMQMLMAMPREHRQAGLVVRELINRSAPLLNFPRLNGPNNLFEMWKELELEKIEFTEAPKLDEVRIIDSSNVVEEIEASSSLSIPQRFLTKGTAVRGKALVAASFGSACVRLHQRYANSNGKGSFCLRVLVNQEIVFEIDGALYGKPFNVSLHNVKRGDVVEVEVAALRDMSGYASWERATSCAVLDVSFYKSAPAASAERFVTADLPSDVEFKLVK